MKKSKNKDIYYHEEITYNSFKENWSALGSLLLIPLFIFLVGFGVYTTFQLPKPDRTTIDNKTNGIQIGVGGGPGPDITITPTITPGLLDKGKNLYTVQ